MIVCEDCGFVSEGKWKGRREHQCDECEGTCSFFAPSEKDIKKGCKRAQKRWSKAQEYRARTGLDHKDRDSNVIPTMTTKKGGLGWDERT